MIIKYDNGTDLINENKALLDTNKYLSVFFTLDAPLLTQTDKINYALKVVIGKKVLLAMKVEPYNLLLFGVEECVPELLEYLFSNGYEIEGYLCGEDIGNRMMDILEGDYRITYYEALAMDFMEAAEFIEPSSSEVITAEETDIDEICECLQYFVVDCGLLDQVNRERTAKSIFDFRLIKEDGRIVSMAKMAKSSDKDIRITDVYTRNEYRGKGYARKVVNTLKNEIISVEKIATLNVDKKNPISYHLYLSLGFKRVFSQGEYRRC